MRTSFLPLFASLCAAACISAAEPPQVRTADLATLIATSPKPVQVSGPMEPSSGTAATEWRGDDGKEMARVAALPPIALEANGNDLRSVLRAVCDRSNMRLLLVGDDPVMQSPVTLQATSRPWELLQALASTYGLEIVLKHGLWNIYVANTGELVSRTYLLRHNTLEKFSSAGDTNGTPAASRDSAQGTQGRSPSSASPDRTGQSVFGVDSNAIVAAVKEFLTLPPNAKASFAGADGGLGMPGPRRGGTDASPSTAAAGQGGVAGAGIVKFTSENNTLTVVATRAQHEFLAAWLAQMDQPQKQIVIESKFLLTSVNPQSHAGLENPLMTDSGVSAGFSEMTNRVDPFNVSTWKLPTAVLTASDMNFKLNALASKTDSKMVQYPTQVTLSGREVTLRSVKQVPIVSTSMRDTAGSATTTSAQIQFIDVGTVVAILPKVLNDKNVLLNISIQVSSVDRTVTIEGNPYPVVINQTYHNQVIVESGYSLALGGLEQTLATNDTKKLPILGDIPWFGFLAKDVKKDGAHSVLTMIVTPEIMADYRGGNMSGTAQHTLPATGAVERPMFQPGPTSTIEDVQLSLRGFSRDLDELDQVLREERGDRRMYGHARLLANELDLMTVTLKRERAHGRTAPALEADIKSYRSRIKGILHRMPTTEPLG